MFSLLDFGHTEYPSTCPGKPFCSPRPNGSSFWPNIGNTPLFLSPPSNSLDKDAEGKKPNSFCQGMHRIQENICGFFLFLIPASQPTSTLFCKRPFTDTSSLLYNFYSPSLSLADATLSYLSTGTREIFPFSFQTCASDLPGQTKLGKEVMAKTIMGNCIQLWKQQATAVVLEQQKA